MQKARTFIDLYRGDYGVEPICRVLQVAPSGYRHALACLRHPELRSRRAKREKELLCRSDFCRRDTGQRNPVGPPTGRRLNHVRNCSYTSFDNISQSHKVRLVCCSASRSRFARDGRPPRPRRRNIAWIGISSLRSISPPSKSANSVVCFRAFACQLGTVAPFSHRQTSVRTSWQRSGIQPTKSPSYSSPRSC